MLELIDLEEVGVFFGFRMVILFLNSPKMSSGKCRQVKADIQTAAEWNVWAETG